jgi:hypothetical protein
MQAQNLQTQILEVGGPKLKRAQAKVDAIANALDTLMQSLSTAEVGEGNAKKQAAKAAQARVKSEKELEKVRLCLQSSLHVLLHALPVRKNSFKSHVRLLNFVMTLYNPRRSEI